MNGYWITYYSADGRRYGHAEWTPKISEAYTRAQSTIDAGEKVREAWIWAHDDQGFGASHWVKVGEVKR